MAVTVTKEKLQDYIETNAIAVISKLADITQNWEASRKEFKQVFTEDSFEAPNGDLAGVEEIFKKYEECHEKFQKFSETVKALVAQMAEKLGANAAKIEQAANDAIGDLNKAKKSGEDSLRV